MSLKSIPRQFRNMIVTTRQFDPAGDDGDLIAFERDFQVANRLQSGIHTDKVKAVRNIDSQIKKVKHFLNETKDDRETQKRLESQLDQLYVERYALLKNEILNACKIRGLLDEKKLASFPGSPQYIEKRERERKNKPESKSKEREINDTRKDQGDKDSHVNPKSNRQPKR